MAEAALAEEETVAEAMAAATRVVAMEVERAVATAVMTAVATAVAMVEWKEAERVVGRSHHDTRAGSVPPCSHAVRK